MKLVALADLHCQYPVLPEGDILAISGDLTYRGTLEELGRVCSWLEVQDFKHKVVIAGNHDFCFQNRASKAQQYLANAGVKYLQDTGTTIEGRTFYGSPWQPWFHNWAFNVDRGYLHRYWSKIPENLDVLLVHGPPFGYGDRTSRGERVGCEELVPALLVKKPKKVFYGHIHEDVGHWTINDGATDLYNCSIGPDYSIMPKPSGLPVVVEI